MSYQSIFNIYFSIKIIDHILLAHVEYELVDLASETFAYSYLSATLYNSYCPQSIPLLFNDTNVITFDYRLGTLQICI